MRGRVCVFVCVYVTQRERERECVREIDRARERMCARVCLWLVSWCFKPSQPQRITSGRFLFFFSKLYQVIANVIKNLHDSHRRLKRLRLSNAEALGIA